MQLGYKFSGSNTDPVDSDPTRSTNSTRYLTGLYPYHELYMLKNFTDQNSKFIFVPP